MARMLEEFRCSQMKDLERVQAFDRMEVGEARLPQVRVISARDMVSISTSDIAASTTLFSIWGGLVGLGVLLASLFNYSDTRARSKFLKNMFAANSTCSLWYMVRLLNRKMAGRLRLQCLVCGGFCLSRYIDIQAVEDDLLQNE